MNIVLHTSEYCCYTSSALSALVAYRLLRMGNFRNLTFINQMFVVYCLQTQFWVLLRPTFYSNFSMICAYTKKNIKYLEYDELWIITSYPSQLAVSGTQVRNCFLTVWMFTFTTRGLYHTGMVFCRRVISPDQWELTDSFSDLCTSATPRGWSRRGPGCFTGSPWSS